jgi:hypothetical protein
MTRRRAWDLPVSDGRVDHGTSFTGWSFASIQAAAVESCLDEAITCMQKAFKSSRYQTIVSC